MVIVIAGIGSMIEGILAGLSQLGIVCCRDGGHLLRHLMPSVIDSQLFQICFRLDTIFTALPCTCLAMQFIDFCSRENARRDVCYDFNDR